MYLKMLVFFLGLQRGLTTGDAFNPPERISSSSKHKMIKNFSLLRRPKVNKMDSELKQWLKLLLTTFSFYSEYSYFFGEKKYTP